jgi:hypothetical protein
MVIKLSAEQEVLQERILGSCDQFVVASGRSIEVGVIGPDTRFPSDSQDLARGFLVNIRNAHTYSGDASDGRFFVHNEGVFSGKFLDGRSPEIYVGDSKAIPFLEERFEGYHLLQLPIALGRDFPVKDEIREEVEQGQLKLYVTTRIMERIGCESQSIVAIKMAMRHGYHFTGSTFEFKKDAGVTEKVNFKEFFADRVNRYGLDK